MDKIIFYKQIIILDVVMLCAVVHGSTNITVLSQIISQSATTITSGQENVTAKSIVKDQFVDIIERSCPQFTNIHLTQSDLLEHLIDPCRYDKIQRPPNFDADENSLPVDVYIRTYVFYMQNLDTQSLQFTLQMRFQVRYNDQRLVFSKVGANHTNTIIGDENLKHDLWIPHLFFVNEKSSGILGLQNHDIITTISSDGTVIISSRIQVSLYCSMDFRNFPLDQQNCKSIIGSRIYNTSDVKLHWEADSAFTMGSDKILTEYTSRNASLAETQIESSSAGLQYGHFTGNYSCLTFTITFDRFLGYYLLEFYCPSIMLVVMSWISFWLQADQTSPRAMLGATSMLTFITLSSSQTKALPKVSYIKASEIWSIGCAFFIFGSLIEFAFVNLLWRRRKHVMMKEVTTANILKKTLTPTMFRKNYDSSSGTIRKFHSDSSLNKEPVEESSTSKMNFDHRLSVSNPPTYKSVESIDAINSDKSVVDIVIPVPSKSLDHQKHKHTLTHQEIAILLDKRARLMFPVAFLVFNIFYWILVTI